MKQGDKWKSYRIEQFNSSYFHYVKPQPAGGPIESTFFSFIVSEAGSRHSNEAFNLEKHLGKARESGRDVPETSPEEGDPFQAAQCNTTSTSNRVMGSGKDELLNWWKKIDAFFPVS